MEQPEFKQAAEIFNLVQEDARGIMQEIAESERRRENATAQKVMDKKQTELEF